MANQPRRREEIEDKLIERAWKDQRFKLLLLKNPRAACKELGIEMPENLEMKVVEEKPNSVTFVIPAAPNNVHELSPQELEKLAGGIAISNYTCPGDPKCQR